MLYYNSRIYTHVWEHKARLDTTVDYLLPQEENDKMVLDLSWSHPQTINFPITVNNCQLFIQWNLLQIRLKKSMMPWVQYKVHKIEDSQTQDFHEI